MTVKNGHRCKFSNLSSWKEKPEKEKQLNILIFVYFDWLHMLYRVVGTIDIINFFKVKKYITIKN